MPKVKDVSNNEVAEMLREVSAAYESQGDARFQAMAYDKAADSVEHASSNIKDIWEEGKLQELPGIGGSIAQHLDEYFKTGRVKHFEKLKGEYPEGMFELIKVTGIGPKNAYRLADELGIKNIGELKEAAEKGEIEELEGFGEKSQQEILTGIKELKDRPDRFLLPHGFRVAQKIIERLEKLDGVVRVDSLGSLRRMSPTIGDVDLAVATKGKPQKIIEFFTAMNEVKRVLASGDKKASILLENGIQVDLRVQDPETYGAQLQYFTGSKNHNVTLRTYAQERGLSLSEYGIKNTKTGKVKEFDNEEDFYKELEMDWIPPELREDRGEIEAALKSELPDLIELTDIKGDLHVHSDFETSSPLDKNKKPLEKVLKKAESMGYEYIGISDHNPRTTIKERKEVKEELKKRRSYIEQLSDSLESLRVLIGLEVDIFADGSLSIDADLLESLDYYIVSVHGAHRQSKSDMTERILKALDNPGVSILGHPTGRILMEREGVEADWRKILEKCADKGVFVEINAYPDRLDLPDYMIKDAKKAGVKFIVNTDTHDIESLENMRFGVSVARRGWLEPKDVVNTLPYKELTKLLKHKQG